MLYSLTEAYKRCGVRTRSEFIDFLLEFNVIKRVETNAYPKKTILVLHENFKIAEPNWKLYFKELNVVCYDNKSRYQLKITEEGIIYLGEWINDIIPEEEINKGGCYGND